MATKAFVLCVLLLGVVVSAVAEERTDLAIPGVSDIINGAKDKAKSAISSGFSSVVTTLKSTATNSINSAQSTFQTAIDNAANTAKNGLSTAKSDMDALSSSVSSTLTTVSTGAQNALDRVKGELNKLVTKSSVVADTLKQVQTKVSQFVTVVWNMVDIDPNRQCTSPAVVDQAGVMMGMNLNPKWCVMEQVLEKFGFSGLKAKMQSAQTFLLEEGAQVEDSDRFTHTILLETGVHAVDYKAMKAAASIFNALFDVAQLGCAAVDVTHPYQTTAGVAGGVSRMIGASLDCAASAAGVY